MATAFALPAVTGVLSLIAQMGEAQSRAEYETALAAHRAGVLHDLIDAAYHKRFKAIRSGFKAILAQYGEQAAHYMEQQRAYAAEELSCTDAIRRVELRSRLREADTHLQNIRIDAQLLYAHMLHAIDSMGMPSLDFAREFIAPLALPKTTGAA